MTAARRRLALAAFLAGLAGPALAPVAAQPAAVEALSPFGKPKAFKVGKQAAIALWYDDYWHFNITTNKKSKDTFTGSVRADKGKLIGVFDALDKGNKAVASDLLVPHKDGGGFDYRFTNGGGIDALRFKAAPEATTLTVTVMLNGQPAPQVVLVGRDGKHPEKVPFALPAQPK